MIRVFVCMIDLRLQDRGQVGGFQPLVEVQEHSLGIEPVMRSRQNCRDGVITYSAHSMPGSERPNQFCVRWMRSIVAIG